MVYILKFDRPIGGRANYYIGWCEDHRFNARMRHHERGTGARLTQVARERPQVPQRVQRPGEFRCCTL